MQDYTEAVPVLNTGIAWTSDKEIKFRNPPGDLKTGKALGNYVFYYFCISICYTIGSDVLYLNTHCSAIC